MCGCRLCQGSKFEDAFERIPWTENRAVRVGFQSAGMQPHLKRGEGAKQVARPPRVTKFLGCEALGFLKLGHFVAEDVHHLGANSQNERESFASQASLHFDDGLALGGEFVVDRFMAAPILRAGLDAFALDGIGDFPSALSQKFGINFRLCELLHLDRQAFNFRFAGAQGFEFGAGEQIIVRAFPPFGEHSGERIGRGLCQFSKRGELVGTGEKINENFLRERLWSKTSIVGRVENADEFGRGRRVFKCWHSQAAKGIVNDGQH